MNEEKKSNNDHIFVVVYDQTLSEGSHLLIPAEQFVKYRSFLTKIMDIHEKEDASIFFARCVFLS